MKNYCFLITLIICSTCLAQNPILGIFDGHTDIGNVSKTGTVEFNLNSEEYKIGGSGSNMWENNDDFHFVWRQLTGDFIIKANFNFIGKGIFLVKGKILSVIGIEYDKGQGIIQYYLEAYRAQGFGVGMTPLKCKIYFRA